MSIPNGFAAAFIRLYYQEQELSAKVKSLKYTYDEEDDDVVEINIESADRSAPDQPWCQEGAELKLVFGFIQGPTWGIRKVWVKDLKWKMGPNLQLTISAAEKGTDLKNSTERTVYKNATIAHVAADKAEKHGLELEVEVPDSDTFVTVKKGEKLEDVLVRERRERISKIPLSNVKLSDLKKMDPPKDTDSTFTVKWGNMNITLPKAKPDEGFRKTFEGPFASLNKYVSIPQANKSDAQMLSDMAKREKNTHTVVETRDNKITIRRRNFSQKPYRTYEFGSSTGDLIEFTPHSKKKRAKGSADTVGFSGWNAGKKSAFSGEADADNDPTLSKWTKALKFYRTLAKKSNYGTAVVGKIGKTIPLSDGNNGVTVPIKYEKGRVKPTTPQVTGPVIDQSRATNGVIYKDYTVIEHIKAIEGAIKERQDLKSGALKNIYNAMGINPEDAYNDANNLRAQSELKTNPATAQIWGDPNLVPGKLITITGVGKKYSGNYYISKATHSVDQNGYMVDLELQRQGNNMQAEGDVTSESLGKKVNTQRGEKTTQPAQKTVKPSSQVEVKFLSQEIEKENG